MHGYYARRAAIALQASKISKFSAHRKMLRYYRSSEDVSQLLQLYFPYRKNEDSRSLLYWFFVSYHNRTLSRELKRITLL